MKLLRGLFNSDRISTRLEELGLLSQSKEAFDPDHFAAAAALIRGSAELQKLLDIIGSSKRPIQVLRLLLLLRLIAIKRQDLSSLLGERGLRLNEGLPRGDDCEGQLVSKLIIPFSFYLVRASANWEVVRRGKGEAVQMGRVLHLLRSITVMGGFMRTFARYFLKEFQLLLDVYDQLSDDLSQLSACYRGMLAAVLRQEGRDLSSKQLLAILELTGDLNLINYQMNEIVFNRHYKERSGRHDPNVFRGYDQELDALVLLVLRSDPDSSTAVRLARLKERFQGGLELQGSQALTTLHILAEQSFHSISH